MSTAPSLQSAAAPEDEDDELLPIVSVSVIPVLLDPLVSGSPVVVDPSEDELSVSPVVVVPSLVDGDELPDALLLVDGFVDGSPLVSPVVPSSLPVSSLGQPVNVTAAAPIES